MAQKVKQNIHVHEVKLLSLKNTENIPIGISKYNFIKVEKLSTVSTNESTTTINKPIHYIKKPLVKEHKSIKLMTSTEKNVNPPRNLAYHIHNPLIFSDVLLSKNKFILKDNN